MRGFLAALCAMVWTFGAAADVAHERAELKDAFTQSEADNADLKALSARLDAIIADKSFAELNGEEQRGAYALAAAARYDMQDYAAAEPLLLRVTAMPQAIDFEWHLLVQNSFRLQHFPQAADGITALARHWPDKLDFSDQAIFAVGRELRARPEERARADAFRSALFDANWKPEDEFLDADSIWQPLVVTRLERGDVEGAGQAAARLLDPTSMMALRADKRFDAIVAADPDHFDVMKQYDVTLAKNRALAAAAPDKLEGVNAVASLLRTLGRPQEALALIQDALARDAKDPKTFSDRDDQMNWAQNQLSSILIALGRSDEALAAMERGAALKESGTVNISQTLNLAQAYDDYGRPADALKTVADLKLADVSAYGRMVFTDARACAYVALGDGKNLSEAVGYAKAHARDGAGPFLHTLLCTGDTDALAAEVIAELEDPERRADMLARLQDYPPDPYASENGRKIHETWLAVSRRGDVTAAVAKVGRIESYKLYGQSY